jgi:hypothetical protein
VAVSDDLSIPNTNYRSSRAGRYGTGPNRPQQGMDPDTRRLMMFAGALGVVLVSLIGASALINRHGGEVPVITADTRPIREKPVNPGGMKIDGAENDVFSAGSDTSNARLAPQAETPNTNALQAPTPTLPVPAFSAPAFTAPETPVVKAPAATTPGATTQSATVATPSGVAPVAPPPAAALITTPPALPANRPAVVAVAPSAAKPVTVKPPVAVVETHPPTAGHPPMVQLAALTSEDAARHAWEQLSARMPDLLKGRQPSFSRTERDGHTFWRVRTAGFADIAQARGFCDHVRAKGGACSVAEF